MKVSLATGRRKTSVAQVRIIPGNGNIIVNKTDFFDYFPLEVNRKDALKPLEVTQMVGKFDIIAKVHGGGKTGQTGAMQLALSRALVNFNEDLKSSLRGAGLLTRDPRMVERKKYGLKKARKRFQFSKR
ncbi:MAG: 30S ribosomal protein S9 [Candidatus Kapabacteria bacterium]|nr:30S ribosomal protein S9 [Candidatus Kapabacteria bacterium]